MKRISLFLVSVISFFILSDMVLARSITFDEVKNKYKEKFDFNKVDETLGGIYQEFENKATVNVTSDKIEVVLDDNKTLFTYKDGIINYEYTGSKELSDVSVSKTMIDNAFITKLLYVVLMLKDNSINDITSIFGNRDETSFTMADDGLEIKMFKAEYNDDSGHSSITAIDTLKLDINKFDLKKNNTGNKEEENNDVDSPNTGIKEYAILSGIILIIILILIKFKAKSVISKI